MPVIILGFALIGLGSVMDFEFRLRLKRLGKGWIFLRGGSFDHRDYHEVRAANGWPAWPVYVMWAPYGCGIALLITGFFIAFGTHPPGR
jgi:hypothetical protein